MGTRNSADLEARFGGGDECTRDAFRSSFPDRGRAQGPARSFAGVPYGSTRAPLWQATQSLCALFGEQHSHWAPAIRTDCDGPGTPASIRRDAMRLHLSHLRERGRPGTGLPVRGSLGFRPPRAAFLSLSGQSVAGTGEPPGTARTFDLLILST
eukprot:tig00001206_g7491.t1